MNVEKMCQDLTSRSQMIYSEIYMQLRENGVEADKKELSFKIIDSIDINGRSWCSKKRDNIVICKGVISEFLLYFSEVNNYYVQQVLHKIMPTQQKEEISKMSIEGILYDAGNPTIFDSKNIVDERTNLMEIFVSRFILLHEMGHIFDGHYEYLKLKDESLNYLSMFPQNESDCKNALCIRTLEMDADAFAVTRSFYHLLFLFMNFTSQVNCKFLKPIDLFLWWSFAIRSHFLLLEDKHKDTNKFSEEMVCFPSNIRWLMVHNVFGELVNTLDDTKIDREKVWTLMLIGAQEADNVFNAIKGTNYHIEKQFKVNEELKYYLDQANNKWKEIVDELQRYARCLLFKD